MRIGAKYPACIITSSANSMKEVGLPVQRFATVTSLVMASKVEFFVDDDPNCTIQQIKSKAKIHKAKHGLELLVIDYIQLIKGTKQNREQEIAEISRNLKLLAKELQITVIVLAQLSRKCEERADKRPMLSDIRESGSIEQDADVA